MKTMSPYPHTVLVGEDRGTERSGAGTTWHWRCGCGSARGGYTSERRCRDDGHLHQQAHTRRAKEARIPRVLVLNEDGMTNGWRPLFIGDALALTETVSGLTVVGLAMFFDLAEDVEPGDVCASGDIGHSSVNLRPDIGVRKDVEGPLPPTLDKVFDWLVAKGLDVGRHDALELLRILNGWDGPKPE